MRCNCRTLKARLPPRRTFPCRVPDDPVPLIRRIDLISLRPDASRAEVEHLCIEAREQGCLAICVPGSRVSVAAALLEESRVKVSALIGFPFGNCDADVKRYEIEAAIDAGAQEFDAVLNLGWIRDGSDRSILRELRDLREAAEERPVKAVLEFGLLTSDEIRRATALILEAELQFVVTATGCAARPTTPADVALLRETAGPDLGIKAVGSIHSPADARLLVEAGANRVGVFQLAPFAEA